LPTSPQLSASSLAPFDSTNVRSGSWAIAHLNQAGAGGSSPLNGASGARTSGGRSSEWNGRSS
jgi:hypothetical protein